MQRKSAILLLLLGSRVAAWQRPLSVELGNLGVISPEVSRFVEDLRARDNVAGIAVAVVHGESTEYGTWGTRSEDGASMTASTLFGIASCSKAFASTALGILMDDFSHGRNVTPLPASVTTFDWHSIVADLLPDHWELADEWSHKRATLRDVLTHVSGISSHDHTYLPADSPVDVIRRMKLLRPTYELRQEWVYSNQFYMLAAEIIKKFSGMSYVNFVQTRIFDPANMTSSTFSETKAATTGNLSQGWNAHGRLMPYWFPDNMTELAAGPMGVISNAVDLSRWLGILVNAGKHPLTGKVIIPETVLEEITTVYSVMFKQPMDDGFSIAGYGLGWARHSYYGYEVIWHPGGVPGVTSLLAFLPKEKVGVAVLVNAFSKNEVINAVAYRLIADVLGIKPARTVNTEISLYLPPNYERLAGVSDNDSISSITLESFIGTYTSPGYNTITLCAPISTSGDCPDVLHAFHHVDKVSPYKSRASLYASYSGTWSSHLRLVHLPDEENTFFAQFPYLFPYGYGKNTSGFEMMEPGLSEAIMKFVFDGEGKEKRALGIGMYRLSLDISERQRKGGSIEETADVWWEPA